MCVCVYVYRRTTVYWFSCLRVKRDGQVYKISISYPGPASQLRHPVIMSKYFEIKPTNVSDLRTTPGRGVSVNVRDTFWQDTDFVGNYDFRFRPFAAAATSIVSRAKP